MWEMRVKEQRNTLHELRKRKANWIGHILRRNCLLQQVIEGKIQGGIEVTGRWGRKCRKLLDDLKEKRGYSHLKEEALDRTKWRAGFGRGLGPVVRQTTKWMNVASSWLSVLFVASRKFCGVACCDSGKGPNKNNWQNMFHCVCVLFDVQFWISVCWQSWYSMWALCVVNL
jgi:hypothetical protein